jgi:hypothetical protein
MQISNNIWYEKGSRVSWNYSDILSPMNNPALLSVFFFLSKTMQQLLCIFKQPFMFSVKSKTAIVPNAIVNAKWRKIIIILSRTYHPWGISWYLCNYNVNSPVANPITSFPSRRITSIGCIPTCSMTAF